MVKLTQFNIFDGQLGDGGRKSSSEEWLLGQRLRRLFIVVFTFLTCANSIQDIAAQDRVDKATERKVKVAYIYNFCRYIDWPDGAFNGAESPLVIGVLGNDPFGAAFDALAERKTVKGRQIAIARFDSPEDYRPVHVLFVTNATDERIHQGVIQEARGKPMLVIGESPGFGEQGAAVNFYHDTNGTIGFEINVDAAARQQLRVNAKLLKLATVVSDNGS
jgi:hypothetical protein